MRLTFTPPPAPPSAALLLRRQQIYCPLCPESFLDEDFLTGHIAAAHGKQHVYLKVNGRIVRDLCWTTQPIQECELVLLGVPTLPVTVTVEGRPIGNIVLKKTTSLIPHLRPAPREGRIDIRTAGPIPRSFTIFVGRQPAFDGSRIDAALVPVLEKLREDIAVDLIHFGEKCSSLIHNEVENRYLCGVVEYCHAIQLEGKGEYRLAKDRLELAMDLLTPFRTTIANETRHALSLKMNSFAGRWDCDAESPFWLSEQFFCAQARGLDDPAQTKIRPLTIPVDSITRRVLDAVQAYYERDEGATLDIVCALRRGPLRGRNDEDKLTLLEARTKARAHDRSGATQAYASLHEHPVFGTEATSYAAKSSAGTVLS